MAKLMIMNPPSLRPSFDHAEEIYRAMCRARHFDEIAVALQRQGAIAGYGQARGQEATQIGATIGRGGGDMVFPSYRQPGAALLAGVSVQELLSFHARSSHCPWDWVSLRFAPYTIPVGSQLSHATGWALASQKSGLEDDPKVEDVTIVFFGDGASSQGEVHEALNFAAVFAAPVIFVCENNGWAISAPSSLQTRASALYVRALGYGMHGVQVDGNDVFAVRAAVYEARQRAKAGLGPTLIEAITYRIGGHTTADDPSLYRSAFDVKAWEARDPLHVFESYCQQYDVIGSGRLESIRNSVTANLEGEVDDYLATIQGRQS